MTIKPHPKYKKAYQKRIKPHPELVARATHRLTLFQQNPSNPLLKDHALKGSDQHLRAFSISGDIRIIYQQLDQDTVLFLDIGTHNQVYR
jgi:addiction module RelE/StbE family toxin